MDIYKCLYCRCKVQSSAANVNIFFYFIRSKVLLTLQVCKKFNEVGSKLLSRGFVQVERRHSIVYKRVKSMLPRRESERRMHPLARCCDVLSAIETRISMLSMTFMKYIDNNLCCFIPGKVMLICILLLRHSKCKNTSK